MADKGNIPKFDPGVYTKIALNDLVVFSIHFLHDQGINAAAEDIVSTSFRLFPKRFALRKFPHWPDSAVVGRRWSECRVKGWIIGDTITGFKLTPKGLGVARRVGKRLGIVQPAPVKKRSPVGKVKKKHAPMPSKKARVVRKHETKSQVQVKEAQAAPLKKARAMRKHETKPQVQELQAAPVPSKQPHVVPKHETKFQVQVKEAQAAPLKKMRPVQRRKVQGHPARAREIQIVPEPPVPTRVNSPAQVEMLFPAHVPVPAEVKTRAGKFVRMMEQTDAFVDFKRHGLNSKFGEFDFRSMLLCTMESSSAALGNNVKQFKDYAAIHDRQDLLVFLNFCEDRFSHLLAVSTKSGEPALKKQLDKAVRKKK
jgi:hypothetical protein